MADENLFKRAALFQQPVTLQSTLTSSGANTFTGANTIGTGGTLVCSGTGYIDRRVSIANRVEFYDDFLGDLIEDGWNSQADTGGTVALATAPGASGIVTLTTDTTDDDTIMIAHELNWTAAMAPEMVVRLKLDVVTGVGLYIGFTDAKTETSPNLPMGRSGTTITTTATDACGLFFDTDSTTDVWVAHGVKADVDGTAVDGASGPTAATYTTLRVAISTAGTLTAYVDDVLVGTVANAVTTTTKLTPYIGMANRAAAAHVLSVDYILVQGNRV